MRKIIFSFIFVFAFSFSIFAQNNQARKIDEFKDFGCENLKARTDFFITEIIKTPKSKGYVIIYEGKFPAFNFDRNGKEVIRDVFPRIGEANSRIQLIKYHFKFLGYPPENIIFVNGGFRENLTVEFWLVPKGAELPKLTPTLDKIRHIKGKPPKLHMGDC